MARRYGGKFSPSGDDIGDDSPESPLPQGAYDGARADPVGARNNVLFVPSIVLVFTSLSGGALTLALGLIAAGILAASAFLTHEGLRAESLWRVSPNAMKTARFRRWSRFVCKAEVLHVF